MLLLQAKRVGQAARQRQAEVPRPPRPHRGHQAGLRLAGGGDLLEEEVGHHHHQGSEKIKVFLVFFVCMHISLSCLICLSVFICVSVSFCLPVSLSVWLSECMSVCSCLPGSPSVLQCLPVCLHIVSTLNCLLDLGLSSIQDGMDGAFSEPCPAVSSPVCIV